MGRGGDGSSSGGGGVETGAPCSWRSDRKTLVCVCVCAVRHKEVQAARQNRPCT